MLDGVRIQNYQSLVDVDLLLGRITVLLGDSDSGKSAFLRAIEQASHNDAGSEVLTVLDGQQAVQAEVQFREGESTVTWIKTAKSTDYQFDRDGNSERFKKVQKITPDVVTTTLGIREVQIDTGTGPTSWSRLQFVGQFDQPFLLVDRGGVAAARILGRLTGVHVFAEASKLARQEGTALSDKFEATQERIQTLQDEIVKIGDVETEIQQLNVLVEKLQVVRQTDQRISLIVSNVKTIEGIRERRRQIGFDPAEIEQKLLNLTPTLQIMWRSIGAADQIDQLARKIQELRLRRMELERIIGTELPDLQAVAKAVAMLTEVEVLQRANREIQTRQRERLSAMQDMENRLGKMQDVQLELDRVVPLCPFVDKFAHIPDGPFRCGPLMEAVQLRKSRC